MEKEILKLIEKSIKDYDKKSQRAELLERNEKFREELKEISIKLGKQFFKWKREYEKLGKPENYFDKKHKIEDDHDFVRKKLIPHSKWLGFCDKWNIHEDWNGQINSLKDFIRKPRLEIFAHAEGKLVIKIDAWTTLNDIREIWSEVETAQKRHFSTKVDKKANFSRDIVWYDLNKRYKLRPRQIAQLWEKAFPDKMDLMVINRIKQANETMKDIKRIIKDEGLKELEGRELKDSELLKEIKSGALSKEYRTHFDDEREYYITGKTGRTKVTPPFVETIKQAIRRMQKFIEKAHLKTSFYLNDEDSKDLDEKIESNK